MAEPVARRGRREHGVRNTKRALLNALSVILLLATVAVAALYLLIALRPTVSLNPFPPPTACPTPAVEVTATPVPTPTPFPTPTALRPAPPTPTATPSYPFPATVETGPPGGTPDCRATLRGVVLDREGHGLKGYPVHLGAAEADPAAPNDTTLFSDPVGRWQAVLPAGARRLWYVQLHAPDARQAYPPLSAVVAVRLTKSRPQADITFRASR